MKLLLTNDDGIDAPGLEALLNAARAFGDPVIVAPAGAQSGVSHRVTWQEGVRIEPRGAKRFAIHGTPADCTRLGLLKLVPEAKWVLSGINHGANLGADMHYSGTVAAVREAVLHGWPGGNGNWPGSGRADNTLDSLIAHHRIPDVINLPDVTNLAA